MDSSKSSQGGEECSSNESGWTAYIASPGDSDREYDDDDGEDEEEEEGEEDRSMDEKGKDEVEAEDDENDTDDSMASDASSGPSDQYGHHIDQEGSKNERKIAGTKQMEKNQNEKQIKDAQDKSGHEADSARQS